MLSDNPRYHVGRHVANLQVVNTYEGTYVSTLFRTQLNKLMRVFVGYSHPDIGQSVDGDSSLRQLDTYAHIKLSLLGMYALVRGKYYSTCIL